VTQNWRARPLVSHDVIVNLIASTTTATGLKVRCQLDTNEYPTGIRVSDDQVKQVLVERNDFHGDWNYLSPPATETIS